MDEPRPLINVVGDLCGRNTTAKVGILRVDRQEVQAIIGRNVGRALREAGCPEKLLGIACCATVVITPESLKEKREQLGQALWESWPKFSQTEWDEVHDSVKESYCDGAQAVLAEDERIRKDKA